MAKNYKIQFVSLRAGTTYVLEIGGGDTNTAAVQLNGAAETFVTEEDRNEDMFQPIRTQSGSFRILDNMCDYDGTIIDETLRADWWKDLLPAKDSDRPVRLIHTEGNTTVVDWQGFMQSQTFSGALYGGVQEREFPVLCPLGVLAGTDVNFNRGLANFATVLKDVCDTIDTKSGSMVHIDTIMVQGGADAQSWLLTKIDWQNFAQEDADGILRAKYSLYEVLEDMCRFWGWTARTKGTTLYLTAADDTTEQIYLRLTRTELNTLSGGVAAGTANVPIPNATLADTSANPVFASTDQTDYKVQGPHKAVVKADCNEHDTIVKFAPKDVEDWIEQGASPAGTYEWVQGDGDLVGYFTCPNGVYKETGRQGTNIGTKTLKVSTSAYGGVSRRQIYQSTESESPVVGDMLMALSGYVSGLGANEPILMLQTLRPMSFGGGSISLGGTAWMGTEPLQQEDNLYSLSMRLGVGMTRETAKWWYMSREIYSFSPSAQIERGWALNSPSVFNVPLQGNNLKSTGVMLAFFTSGLSMSIYNAIPVEANTYGYIFIDVMGAHDYTNGNEIESFEIANLEISYSRETIDIPTSTSVVRARELKQERVTTKEYSAVNTNDSKEEWNANCIFASDNNMEYGYGLLLDASGNIIPTVNYGGTPAHPEQHLADRVVNYWATAKRMLDLDVLKNNIAAISPHTKVTVGSEGGQFVPLAIGHDWRNDKVKLTLIQL